MSKPEENGSGGAGSDGVLHVAFVLDRSGSMEAVAEAVVEGYNDYLGELRAQGGETLYSLTTFNTSFEHVCVGEPLERAPELDHRLYRPDGMTALYDAIAHTVLETDRRLQAQGRGEEKVLVVVMTDGLENSSTDYDAHAIAELVRGYDERPNWTFVYLGAGHESIAEARAGGGAHGLSGEERDALVARPGLDAQVHARAGRRDPAPAPLGRPQERALLRGSRPVRDRLQRRGAARGARAARTPAASAPKRSPGRDPPSRPRRRPRDLRSLLDARPSGSPRPHLGQAGSQDPATPSAARAAPPPTPPAARRAGFAAGETNKANCGGTRPERADGGAAREQHLHEAAGVLPDWATACAYEHDLVGARLWVEPPRRRPTKVG